MRSSVRFVKHRCLHESWRHASRKATGNHSHRKISGSRTPFQVADLNQIDEGTKPKVPDSGLRGISTILRPKGPERGSMKDDCKCLDWLYRFLNQRKTEQGQDIVIREIKRHFRHGNEVKPC